MNDPLGKVRDLCGSLSVDALRTAIAVHRSNCRQPSCLVLAAMVATAEARDADEESTS